jgi:hypothetical protein
VLSITGSIQFHIGSHPFLKKSQGRFEPRFSDSASHRINISATAIHSAQIFFICLRAITHFLAVVKCFRALSFALVVDFSRIKKFHVFTQTPELTKLQKHENS